MSITKNRQSNDSNIQKNMGVAIVVITICAGIVAMAIGYHWGYYKGTQKNQENGSIMANNTLNDEFGNVTLCQGKVVSIEGNKLLITAKVDENGEKVEKTVTVNTTDNTTYRKVDISVPPIDPEELENGVENSRETAIELKDVQIGDNIIAEASENIYGKTSFQTYQVTVLSIGN
ncbi:MAG: hypothetical protein WCT33_00595 [Patescibacteria group bacterium]|jgi:hypothetical protein